jgi:hypothetical protein
LTFHWYAGEAPPLEGVAVKVTVDPAHTGFCEGVTFTLTGSNGLTVMVMAFEVAGLFEMQTNSEEVRTQVTISLFVGV